MGCMCNKKSSNQNNSSKSEGASNHPSRADKYKESTTFNTANFVQKETGTVTASYELREQLGDGAFGKVFRARHKTTGDERAIKTIRKAQLEGGDRMKSFINEIEILRHMDHPNILRLYEFYEDSKNFHLVTEICTGGELFDRIVDEKHFNEQKAAKVMQQLLSSLVYCHSKNIVHRDLKPENLLLENSSKDAAIKVIDFGTAEVFDPKREMKKRTGTPYYIAPEVLNQSYTEKCDIWSAGVIMYILLSGMPPFPGKNDHTIMAKVREGKFSFKDPVWNSVSDDAKDLITKMLTMNPKQRPSAQQCLQHDWIVTKVQTTVDEPLAIATLTNLKNFRAEQKLFKATVQFIVSQLTTAQERENLKQVFSSLDTNNDGRLSREELLKGYEKHMTIIEAELEINRIMTTVDIDGNGYIDFTEFIAATMDQKKLLSKKKIEACFAKFDRDGSGTINSAELQKLLGGSEGAVDDKVWKEIVKEVDTNGDGEIDLKEFKSMLLRQF